MVVTRRFIAKVGDEIEELEQMVLRGDAHHQAVTTYLAALLICNDDGSFDSDDAVAAATWMTNLGALTWRRKDDQTIVRFRECLN